jgi:hypothetical protein
MTGADRMDDGTFNELVTGMIDYAGLFPPARLDMETAVANYLRYRDESHEWMLGRFIVPAGRLRELASFENEPGLPGRLCVLLGSGATIADDFESVREFLAGREGTIVADAFECRFPDETVAAADPSAWASSLESVRNAAAEAGVSGAELFAEVPLTASYAGTDASAAEGIAAFAREQADKGTFARTGFKLRCGGVDAAAFPTVERVAGVLSVCCDLRIPVKFTAGLHHPLRHRDDDIGADAHGFLNVFGAGALAWSAGLEIGEIESCLRETGADAFRFDREHLYWRDHTLTREQVARARVAFVTAFGSCSFEEPVADLQGLGLLTTD